MPLRITKKLTLGKGLPIFLVFVRNESLGAVIKLGGT